MARRCDLCGKGTMTGNRVSHANNKSKTTFRVNLQRVRANVKGRHLTMRVCTRCLKAGKVLKAA